MRISDWSSDVCSSDLLVAQVAVGPQHRVHVDAERLGQLAGRREAIALDHATAGDGRPHLGGDLGEQRLARPGIDLDEHCSSYTRTMRQADRKSTRLNSSH